MIKLICKTCGSQELLVDVALDCYQCEHNAAWDNTKKEWTSDAEVIEAKGLTRDYVESNGECDMGSAYGGGCYLIVCNKCRSRLKHLPMIED